MFVLRHRASRWGAVLAVAGAAVLLSAAPAFAPHVAHVIVTPAQGKPGEQIGVFGQRGFGSTNPVEIHFDSADGPLLGSFQPNTELYALWGPGQVAIPADAKPGIHTLFATQVLAPNETHIRGIPARAEISVLGPGGAPVLGAPLVPAAPDTAVAGLVRHHPVSTGSIVLVGLAVGGLAMLAAGAIALSASRRQAEGVPVASGSRR